MSIEPITIPMSIEANDVTIDSTFDARIEVVEGGSITVESLSVNTNGTTTAPTGKAYSPVIVNVPASAVDSGTKNITSNGNNQDVVGYAKVNVAVPNSYSAGDEGKVVSSGALVSQTSETYTDNGTYDTTLKNSVTVAIPTQGAQTIHPSSSDQTIASGKYLTGTQTIKGVTTTNLTAANIKKDVVIEIGDSTDSDCVTSVTGTYEGGGGGATNYVMENLEKIAGDSGFKYKSLGEVLNFQSGTYVAERGLQGLVGTKIVVLPSITSMGGYPVVDCTSLEKIDLGSTWTQASTSNYFFSGNTQLNTIILRRSSVPTLGGANCFNDTPFASGGAGGTLYVPSSLISSYQSASNWSTMLARAQNSIVAIEGSQYENYYADGTPIT